MSREAGTGQIGPYRLSGILGVGAMGRVYRAVQPAVNRPVALKVLPEEMEHNADSVRRFALEAETAANLNHPHIVRVWDASVDEPPYYIALQLLEGGTLEERMKGRRLDVDDAVALAVPLLHALDYAHGRGIVHRDIKPANILFDEKGAPHLTDFGIAKAADRPSMTAHGSTFGTPNYMSPEQARGGPMDRLSDLFSMAVIVYEMLAGRTPFVNEDPLVTMNQIVHHDIPPLSDLGVEAPRAIEAVLARALAKDPRARYQSGSELAAALQHALAASSAAHPDGARAERHSPKWAWAALVVTLLAIAAIAGAIAWRYMPPGGNGTVTDKQPEKTSVGTGGSTGLGPPIGAVKPGPVSTPAGSDQTPGTGGPTPPPPSKNQWECGKWEAPPGAPQASVKLSLKPELASGNRATIEVTLRKGANLWLKMWKKPNERKECIHCVLQAKGAGRRRFDLVPGTTVQGARLQVLAAEGHTPARVIQHLVLIGRAPTGPRPIPPQATRRSVCPTCCAIVPRDKAQGERNVCPMDGDTLIRARPLAERRSSTP